MGQQGAPPGFGARMGSLMLEAWQDKVAGVAADSASITSAVLDEGGHRLVMADEDRKLKVCCHCAPSRCQSAHT